MTNFLPNMSRIEVFDDALRCLLVFGRVGDRLRVAILVRFCHFGRFWAILGDFGLFYSHFRPLYTKVVGWIWLGLVGFLWTLVGFEDVWSRFESLLSPKSTSGGCEVTSQGRTSGVGVVGVGFGCAVVGWVGGGGR